MKSHHHALLGAVVAVLPDVALACYGWRREYVPETHPLVRVHRALHSPESIVGAVAVGGVLSGAAWASHVWSDRVSDHPLPGWVRTGG